MCCIFKDLQISERRRVFGLVKMSVAPHRFVSYTYVRYYRVSVGLVILYF